jgi:hypothetical protein
VIKAVACNGLEDIIGNRRKNKIHPDYNFYDPALKALMIRVYAGDQSIPISAQYRVGWEYPRPWQQYKCITVAWADCWPVSLAREVC